MLIKSLNSYTIFSSNFETFASELLEDCDEMFPHYDSRCVDHEQMTIYNLSSKSAI